MTFRFKFVVKEPRARKGNISPNTAKIISSVGMRKATPNKALIKKPEAAKRPKTFG